MSQQTVLVTADALRADHLSHYGYGRNTLPALDELVSEGTLYESAFANGSSTKSSIPSFLTSRFDGEDRLESGPTVFTPLQEAGVTTGALHSNVLLSHEFESVHGCDTYRDFEEQNDEIREQWNSDLTLVPYRRIHQFVKSSVDGSAVPDCVTDLYYRLLPGSSHHHMIPYVDAETVTDAALEWVRERGNEDFFLWVHYMEPHRPCGVSSDLAFVDTPVSDDRIRELMAKAGSRPDELSPEERDLVVDLYDSDIKDLSQSIDTLIRGLAEMGIWEDLSVLFSADHGEEFSEHGAYFHRNHPYDEIIHVPLVVRSPSFESGTSDELRQLIDLGPTVLDLHGIESPDSFQGESLMSRSTGRDYVVSNSCIGTTSVGIRTEKWKFIVDENGEEELYDLVGDPGERESLTDQYPDTCAQLRKLVPSSLQSFEFSNVEREVDEHTAKRLENLGYMT